MECDSCRTPHHPACLEELGGCTVLGCGANLPKAARDPTEQIRARVRRRVDRYRENTVLPPANDEAVRERMADQPPFCAACERELLVEACPACGGELLAECEGDGIHCSGEGCHEFYAQIARKQRGAPIAALTPKGRMSRGLLITLGSLGLLTLAGMGAMEYLLGGSIYSSVWALLIVGGALLALLSPLLIMMLETKKRLD